jgi:uncharacterized membrane protein YgcG
MRRRSRKIGRLATLTIAAFWAVGWTSAARRIAHADDTAPAARERILLIDSDVHVLPDRTLRVQETIRIRSSGQIFKHGIEREFPQIYAGPYGSRVDVGFHVEEVLLDGDPEQFTLRHRGSDAILRAGRRDVPLDLGEHTYRITYVTDRQLGFFADHDELYWNVTGNRSRLTVEQATATITLPPAAQGQVRAATGYIGVAGSRERAKLASIQPTGGTFVAGRPLRPGEGMTVVLEWPKGIVPTPTQAMRIGWWLHDNRDAEIAVLGIVLLAILVSATRARLRAGSEMTAGGNSATGAGTYEGLAAAISPCLLRYVVRRGFDDRSLPIAILDMAERGCVTVRQTGAHYRVDRTEKPLDTLPPEEMSAAGALFGEKPQVELAPVDRKRLSAASEALKFDLDRLAARYVGDGRGLAVLGMLLSFVIVGVALGVGSGDPHVGIIVGLFFSGLGMAFFAIAGWLARTLTGRALKRTNASTVAIALVFAAGFAAADVAIARSLSGELSQLSVALCAGVLFMGYRAVRLWRLRTATGEALYQDARRARQSAPAATSEGATGTGILPYVMALDAVAVWAEGLEGLGQTPGAGVDRRDHRLYQDPNWLWGTSPMQLSSFTDDFSSMTAQAAGPAPGSSSGSSGGSSSSSSGSSDSGGSSGGGGGGGGVGGW